MSKPLNTKNWRVGILTEISPSYLKNIDVDPSGVMRPRKGWTTFAGMVWQLWLINKRYTKLGIRGDFSVRLPLKPGNFKKYK